MLRRLLSILTLAATIAGTATGASPEVHRDTPTFKEVTANAPIPAELHKRNEGGSDGLGLCVIASMVCAGRYVEVPRIDEIWRVAKQRPGGYSPDKWAALIKEVLPREKFASVQGRDPKILDTLSAQGYAVGITMNTAELYGWARIHHMVTLLHYDSSRNVACYVDNNAPGVYVWITADECNRRWVDGPEGWALIWERRAAFHSYLKYIDEAEYIAGLLLAFILLYPEFSPKEKR